VAARRPLKVLLPTLGSAGDVHPFVALGLALRERGHRAILITNPLFQPLIEARGLEFLPLGTLEDVENAVADPDLWHARRGFEVVARRVLLPAIEATYRHIESRADASTVVAASSIAFGARIAQDKLGIPTASVHLQPIVIRSLIEPGMFGTLHLSRSQPLWFKRALFRLIDWAAIDRIIERPLNAFRRRLGLAPVHRALNGWIHSPQCVIAFFPPWFAEPQADWPRHSHAVGFALWDGGGGALPVAPQAEDFLRAGPPPIVVTAGSAAATAQRFFAESVNTLERMRMRGMLVTNFPDQLPARLPEGIQAFGYLPFSEVLPRAALLIHHGGIGTLAQAVKAGVPQLAVPRSHDQFDNGWRIERIGLGRSLPETRFSAARAAPHVHALLEDTEMRRRCAGYSAGMDSRSALERACVLIEALVDRGAAP
jgi:rhamnosyltransferase subunit B